MTDPKGNREFCFPETLNVPRDEAEKRCRTSMAFWPTGTQICRSFKEQDLIVSESKVQVVVSLGISEI